jgi:hypothetical protein
LTLQIDSEFKSLIPPLEESEAWNGYDSKGHYLVSIRPVGHAPGYFTIEKAGPTDITYLNRGVIGSAMGLAFKAMSIDPLQVAWEPVQQLTVDTSIPHARFIATEMEVEDALARWLSDHGKSYQRQVRCEAGIVDVITDTHIYEVKLSPTRDSYFKAVGQVLLYAASLETNLQPVIVVNRYDHAIASLVHHAKLIGVETLTGEQFGLEDRG